VDSFGLRRGQGHQVKASDPILEDWRWTTFDKSDGLAGRVNDLYLDDDKNIWFATAYRIRTTLFTTGEESKR
jgi:hypothetical protein